MNWIEEDLKGEQRISSQELLVDEESARQLAHVRDADDHVVLGVGVLGHPHRLPERLRQLRQQQLSLNAVTGHVNKPGLLRGRQNALQGQLRGHHAP
jgi:hypothetical protein